MTDRADATWFDMPAPLDGVSDEELAASFKRRVSESQLTAAEMFDPNPPVDEPDYVVRRDALVAENKARAEALEPVPLAPEEGDPSLDAAPGPESEQAELVELMHLDPRDLPDPFDDELEADTPDHWPEPPAAAAYHGVLGSIAQAVAPHTEADPVNVLGTLLAMFGAACGGGRALYQGSNQRTNLSILLVGGTGFAGRKGTGLDVGRAVFRLAYPELEALWLVGAASGEAITGHLGRHEDEERVLLVEPEFARLLTIISREGSTLSPVLRNAWDGVPLGHARARDESLITRHHVSLIGHITPVELRTKLTDADAGNGFANRILFLAVRRTQLIAFPTSPDDLVSEFIEPLHRAIIEARSPGEMRFDDRARDLWESFYADLATMPRLGLAGAVTGRHEAQVARLALVYALADRSPLVQLEHLEAAIALADFARRSAVWALGDSTGNRHADVLRSMIADGQVDYQTAKQMTGLRMAADLNEAVAILVDAGLAEVVRIPRQGGGRPTRVIRANSANPAKGARGTRTGKST